MKDIIQNYPLLKINLFADRKVLSAGGQDISYISIRLLDEVNNIYKGFNESVHLYISGNAQMAYIETNDMVMQR